MVPSRDLLALVSNAKRSDLRSVALRILAQRKEVSAGRWRWRCSGRQALHRRRFSRDQAIGALVELAIRRVCDRYRISTEFRDPSASFLVKCRSIQRRGDEVNKGYL